ncbi:MAG: gluconate 2-dehydrogenase subunit 3 family protein [Myxococcales bacterium]|nr:gluconate 2-dehydrogenase subunit 3 family protein [Myxococcales bacterium]MDP3505449.1 gluconate 2-dehydrogenase subunit 3 family protein [Myxococcales bacterium]
MKMYLPPPGSKPARRSVLKRGLIGGALLALGGGGFLFTRKSVEVDPPGDGLLSFTAREFAIVTALSYRVIPHREGFPTVDAVQVARGCDRILTLVDETALTETKQLLMLLENALPNFLFGRRARTFSTMSSDDQDAVLTEWQTSRITLRRTGYTALRGLVMAAYFSSPATWPAIGYPGPLPGIHDPNAPVWKGGGVERPIGNGTFREPAPAVDGGTP